MRFQITTKLLLGMFCFIAALASNSGAGADYAMIGTAELHSMVVDNAYSFEAGREKQFVIIDARTKTEYDQAHIFSAINVSEKEFERSINLLPREKGVLLVVYGTEPETGIKWAHKAKKGGYAK